MATEQVAEAAQKVTQAESAAQEAQQQLSQAEARAQSAEQAKIELSLKLAEVVAQRDSAGDVSGMPSKRAPEGATAADNEDSLQKRSVTSPAVFLVNALV